MHETQTSGEQGPGCLSRTCLPACLSCRFSCCSLAHHELRGTSIADPVGTVFFCHEFSYIREAGGLDEQRMTVLRSGKLHAGASTPP
jgi:hypothetical protein